jgi:hypothetical protein
MSIKLFWTCRKTRLLSLLAFLVNKSGMVWLNNVKFEIVGTDVSVTAKPFGETQIEPVNLNFEN